MNWWRAHNGISNDVKLALVAAKANVRRCDAGWVWIILLDYASQNEPRGSIDGLDEDQIGLMAGIGSEEVAEIITAMRGRGMIAGELLTAWDKRQYSQDYSTERVRRFRNKVKRYETDETVVKRYETPRTDTEQIQNRAEQTTTARTMPKSMEWPETAAAVREYFPAVDDPLVTEIIHDSVRVYVDTVGKRKAPPITDLILAEAVHQSHFKRQESAGAFKTSVPRCVKSWAEQAIRQGSIPSQPPALQ